MIWAIAALLLVQPVLEQEGTLRLVAAGPEAPVTWIVDGREAGTVAAREPLAVPVAAGPHAVVARTEHAGAWQVVVRLETPGPGISYVPAWTAASPGESPPRMVPGLSPRLVAAAVAVAAWSQSKRP
ncbi:MAG TPA: hypothetical protein VM286_01835 [Candidatus Thermoplasmatota archaeon]|nr:hypothetical protein [Candidatus Thermoplasmatota archaeon]